jgi:hypothetical protein
MTEKEKPVTMWSIHPPFGIDPDVTNRNLKTKGKRGSLGDPTV